MTITDRRGISVDAAEPAVASDPNPGTAIKAPVRVGTTANITLSGLQAIDGVTVAEGNRVLVKNQTTAAQNGIYNASSGNWTRALDLDSNDSFAQGTAVLVTQGTTLANTTWAISSTDPLVIDTSSLAWAQINTSAANIATILAEYAAIIALPLVTIGNQSATLANSRRIAVTAPITATDAGAGSTITLALTTPLAQAYGGTGATSFSTLANTRNPQSGNYTVLNADKNSVLALTGSNKLISFQSPANYDTDFWLIINNESTTRGQRISLAGFCDGTTKLLRLYPLTSYLVFSQNGLWFLLGGERRYFGRGGITMYVDPTFGSDTLTDGLTTGAGAMASVLAAWNRIRDETDGPAGIQLALGTTFSTLGELDGDAFGMGMRLVGITGDPTGANMPTISVPGATSCATVRDGAWITWSGIIFHATGNSAIGINIQQKALCDVTNCQFDAFPLGYQISSDDGSDCNIIGNLRINGGASSAWNISNGSKMIVGSVTIDCLAAASVFTNGFANVTAQGRLNLQTPTIVNAGSTTGDYFQLSRHSIATGTATNLPGNSIGTADATSNAY